MTKRLTILFAAAVFSAAIAARAADNLTMADFNYSIKLMVDGYTGSETLANFPVLVRVSESGIPGFHFADMSAKNVNGKALGYDLAFFAENGTRLEIDKDTWDIDKTVGTTGEMLVWVKLPTMAQGTKFYMCYNVADGVYVTNDRPWGDYVGVWHMREASGTVEDATGNNLDATPGGTTANSIAVNGKLGKARQNAVSGASGNLTVPSYSSVYNGTAFTVSGWFYQVAYNGNDSRLFSRKEAYNVAGGWETFTKTVLKSDKTPKEGGKLDTRGQKNDKTYQSDANIDLKKMGWTHLAFAYNGASATMYTNGAVVAASGPLYAPTDNGLALGIGNYNIGNGNASFFGYIDECRLLKSTASADWVKAEYDTVDNSFFVTNAPIAALDVMWAEASGRSGVTNVVWNAAVVGGIVTGLGEGASEAAIEGKFWVDGDSEPAEWTTLTNGLGRLDAFVITVPCQANTTYNYKLRGADDNGRTNPIVGTFTTPIGLAVTWAEKSSRAGVTNVLSHVAVIGGTIDTLDSAPSVTIEGKFWTGETEPTEWTALGEPLSQTGDFSLSVSGLEVDHFYSYKLQAKGSNGIVVSPASGTFMTGHGLAIHWAGSVEQPGVTNVAWNAAVVGGIVEALGDVASCTIEGKFWAAETEPAVWDALGAGVGDGAFSIRIPNLTESTSYHYKLRATETDGSETPAASGSFTTPVGLAVTWAEALGRSGVTNVGCYAATVGGTITCLGNSATATVQGKFWADGESEPGNWTALGSALSASCDFSATVPNFAAGTVYNYSLRVLGANGMATSPVTGTFTTQQGLTVAWSTATSSMGMARISYDFVFVGGQVTALGEATFCAIQAKIWVGGGAEPEEWTTLKERAVLNSAFSVTIADLNAGTTYRYKLRGLGDDGIPTETVDGNFTTPGESGETIGSDYTHFFDDGTNAVWVANDFERYLPFTVTGYTGTETLTNFPVLVEVRAKDTNGFSYDDFYHFDGADIIFVDEKGHIIPHEIDTWNKGGMSLFWVRLPEMNNGTTFTMCYRSPLLETPPDPGNVFEKYVGVWHMNEKGDGVVNLKDSTVNDFETETHAQSLYEGNGRIGGARQVAQNPGSAASYGRIIAFDHDDILRTGVGNVFTYSAWYKLLEQPPKWAYLVSRKSEDADRGWGIQYQETGTAQLRVWSGSRSKTGYKIFKDFSGTGTAWHYWTFVFDGNGPFGPGTNGLFHAYLDGVEVKATVGGFPLQYDIANDETADYDNLCVVGQQNGTGAFKGLVDEARYSKGIRSADWIKAEYVSTMQAQWFNDANKRFVTKGTVSRGNDSLVPVVVWERGTGLPDTILDVSYAYVQFAGTVTYCGHGATECRVEYQIWADGEEVPETWTTLRDHLRAGDRFSVPVTGLKQDMPYNFRIRAVAVVDDQERQNREHAGQFRTNGNVNMQDVEGELMRIDDKFVHRFRAGTYNFYTPDYVTNVEILVVGGGGAGGYKVGGGGGGGGLFHSASFPVTTNTHYRIHVGQGGVAPSNTTTAAYNGKGEHSYFALAGDEENPLIMVRGGGGGGSYADNAEVATGGRGGSGGGGSYAKEGGEAVSNEVNGVWTTYGHGGGRGNDQFQGGSIGKVAAGGGGGAGRAGLGATFDQWSTGGSGGVGVECRITGEDLFYGAGGGGGYIYRTATASDGTENFTKPGGGGSGIGGNAADIRNGTPATSGVANTGAGGGGGSSFGKGDGKSPNDDDTYWQGGDGGDGVVLICYEVHGRDPISEDPRITMTFCDYTDEKGYADIGYRAYWAGIQSQTNDIYVLYSTVSEEDVAAGNGERVMAITDTIGIGETTFTPPAVGYTYYVRLMARKDANSYMYSDEIASFYVPAIRNNGANWHMPVAETNSFDYASIMYALYDPDPEAHLYLYWSENADDVNGDTAPSGDGVRFLDLGTGMQSKDGTVNIPASEGFERDKIYYTRLATGNEAGTKYFLSPRTMVLRTKDVPRVIFPEATWSNQVVTIEFLERTSYLDPEMVDLVAYYGTLAEVFGDNGKLEDMDKAISTNALSVNLGKCFHYPDDMETETQFPLWSPVLTNYYVRLTLETNGVIVAISQRYQHIDNITAVPANTLLVYVNETPHVSCYGDDPATPSYYVAYGGRTEGPGWNHWTNAMWIAGTPYCPVTKFSPSGQYDITQGNLSLSSMEPYWHEEPVLDPATGEQMRDPETGKPVTEDVPYYYMLCYTSSRHIVTNAIFSASIDDIRMTYTGNECDASTFITHVSGIVNEQPVSYQYRVGTNEWSNTITTTYTDIGTHFVQFKASAPNHDDVYGTFTITVDPAPLSATISAADLPFTNAAQVPEITTNVFGHVRPDLNPLTSEFRDEAGEWQSEVPAFTKPGTYKLFFRVSAPNHATFVTNCTFTIETWDYRVNMDGRAGYSTLINVSDPGWLLKATGWTGDQFAIQADRYAKLDETCANGLKLWHNYVIEREDLSKKLVAAVLQSGSRVNADAFVVRFPNVNGLYNTGLRVRYRVDRKLRGESEFTQGELSDKYDYNVPLGPHDPTGLYLFNMVLVPTNELDTGIAVLSSVATVGVMRVSSPLTNTVTVAPWMSMAKEEERNENISVSDAVNPNGLSRDDMILAYTGSNDFYNAWTHDSGTAWKALATVSTKGVSIAEAETTQFAPGSAFWLARSNPTTGSSTNHFYLVGRYTGGEYASEIAGGTTTNPKATLIANPTMCDIKVNDIDWLGKPLANDKITIPREGVAPLDLTWRNGAWSYTYRTYDPRTDRTIAVRVTDVTIPAGTGFWYVRRGEGFTIAWPRVWPDAAQ